MSQNNNKNIISSCVWWYRPVIPAQGRLRQEDLELKTDLDYMAKSILKKQKPGDAELA